MTRRNARCNDKDNSTFSFKSTWKDSKKTRCMESPQDSTHTHTHTHTHSHTHKHTHTHTHTHTQCRCRIPNGSAGFCLQNKNTNPPKSSIHSISRRKRYFSSHKKWTDCSKESIFLGKWQTYVSSLKINLGSVEVPRTVLLSCVQLMMGITGKIFLCLWFRTSLIYINNCPTICNKKRPIYYYASSLYMFRVSTTPIIRRTQNCNYSLWYWSYFCAATSLQRDKAWPRWREVAAVPEAVVTVLCTFDDGCGWHTKHIEWTCRIINRLLCVASRWTIINIELLHGITKHSVSTASFWEFFSNLKLYVNKVSSILWHCIIYIPLYSAWKWLISAETRCCKLFKMTVNASCVRLYLLLLYLSAVYSFETLVTIYHTARRDELEDSRVVPCEIFKTPTNSPKAVRSTSVSEKLQHDLGAWTNPITIQ